MERRFIDELRAVPPAERDAWVNTRLGFADVPDDEAGLPADAMMSFPSAVEEVLAMVDELPLRAEDELVDIGSGAGRAVILAHLLSGARARGIEVQASLVRFARERAAALSLRGVSFVHADAAGDGLLLEEGNVFFLYAPARGALLARIIDRLEATARRRRIAICTVAMDLRAKPWLRARRTSCETLTIYESREP